MVQQQHQQQQPQQQQPQRVATKYKEEVTFHQVCATDPPRTCPPTDGVEFIGVGSGSTLHRLGILCNVSAASICLGQTYYQRLVLAMPLLQNALFLLSTSSPPPLQASPPLNCCLFVLKGGLLS